MTLQMSSLAYCPIFVHPLPASLVSTCQKNISEDKEWNDKYLFTTKYISNLRLDWLL